MDKEIAIVKPINRLKKQSVMSLEIKKICMENENNLSPSSYRTQVHEDDI